MIKAIMFDLDGTLLPMNEEEFTKGYFGLICARLAPKGYDKNELINVIMLGTKNMVKNNGLKTNEQVFWETFESFYGKEKLEDKKLFDDFYLNEFKKTIMFCGKNEKARELIDFVKHKGLKLILASNPLFPKNGMITRMGFVNLKENDFDYISSYENCHYSKPNPKFYEEMLEKNNLKPDEVVYFGNSEKEDLPAKDAGIKTYLISNENVENKIGFDEIFKIIDNLN